VLEPGAVEALTETRAPRELYFQRTPFQLAILTYATFGLYQIYWVIRARRFAERRIERELTPYGYYWTLLIPIWGLIVWFRSVLLRPGVFR
jgi:hypothetical protein